MAATRGEELNTRLTATDDASAVVDKVADKVGDLEDKPHDVELGVDTAKAEEAAKQLDKRLEGLTADEKRVVLKLAAQDAQRDIDRFNKDLARAEKFTDQEIQLRIEAKGNAEAKLDAIQAEIRELDGATPTVDVDVRTNGLDQLRGLLDDLDGRAGGIGSRLATIGVGSPAVAGVAAVAGGLALAAQHAANVAIQADEISKLTGDTVENASRMNAVWKASGFETKDLQDVLLQMAGVLSTNKDLVAQLGINLDDGKSIGERFVQVVDLLATRFDNVGERSVVASQLFGEEGVRQVNSVIARVGDLGLAIQNVPQIAIVHPDDVQSARDVQNNINQIKQDWSAIGQTLGAPVLELGAALTGATAEVGQAAQEVGLDIARFLSPARQANDQLTTAFYKSEQAAASFKKEQLDGLTTFAQVHAKVLEVTGDLGAANIVAVEWNNTTKAQIDAQREHIDALQEVRSQTDGLRATTADYERKVREENAAHAETVERLQDVRSQTDGLRTDLDAAALAAAGLEGNMRLVNDAVSGAREKLANESFLLDLQDQLVRVGEAEAAVREAAKKGANEEAAAKRNQQREVIRLKELVLDLIGKYEDIPAEKVTRIITALDTGDLDKIDAAIAELEAGIKVPVEFVMPKTRAAFESANIALGQGSIPAITFQPPQIVNNTTVFPPIGSTPTTVTEQSRDYLRWNGAR